MTKGLRKTLTVLIGMMGLSGCGAPVLEAMKPQVWKPVSEVWLVDHPQGWIANQVVHSAEKTSVVANTVTVAGNQLVSNLNQALATTPAGLNVMVLGSLPPVQLWSVVQNHPAQRFEVLGTTGLGPNAVPNLPNLRVIQPDTTMQAYLVGWAAGQLASMQSLTQIGWDLDSTSSVTKTEVQAALAGLYAADPTLSVLPLSLSQLATNANASTNPLLPRLVVTPLGYSSNGLPALPTAGTQWVSLTPFAPLAVIQPQGVPSADVLQPDFSAFAANHWQAGTATGSALAPMIQGGQVPPTLQELVKGMALTMTAVAVHSAWSQLPASIQLLWQPIVAVAS